MSKKTATKLDHSSSPGIYGILKGSPEKISQILKTGDGVFRLMNDLGIDSITIQNSITDPECSMIVNSDRYALISDASGFTAQLVAATPEFPSTGSSRTLPFPESIGVTTLVQDSTPRCYPVTPEADVAAVYTPGVSGSQIRSYRATTDATESAKFRKINQFLTNFLEFFDVADWDANGYHRIVGKAPSFIGDYELLSGYNLKIRVVPGYYPTVRIISTDPNFVATGKNYGGIVFYDGEVHDNPGEMYYGIGGILSGIPTGELGVICFSDALGRGKHLKIPVVFVDIQASTTTNNPLLDTSPLRLLLRYTLHQGFVTATPTFVQESITERPGQLPFDLPENFDMRIFLRKITLPDSRLRWLFSSPGFPFFSVVLSEEVVGTKSLYPQPYRVECSSSGVTVYVFSPFQGSGTTVTITSFTTFVLQNPSYSTNGLAQTTVTSMTHPTSVDGIVWDSPVARSIKNELSVTGMNGSDFGYISVGCQYYSGATAAAPYDALNPRFIMVVPCPNRYPYGIPHSKTNVKQKANPGMSAVIRFGGTNNATFKNSFKVIPAWQFEPVVCPESVYMTDQPAFYVVPNKSTEIAADPELTNFWEYPELTYQDIFIEVYSMTDFSKIGEQRFRVEKYMYCTLYPVKTTTAQYAMKTPETRKYYEWSIASTSSTILIPPTTLDYTVIGDCIFGQKNAGYWKIHPGNALTAALMGNGNDYPIQVSTMNRTQLVPANFYLSKWRKIWDYGYDASTRSTEVTNPNTGYGGGSTWVKRRLLLEFMYQPVKYVAAGNPTQYYRDLSDPYPVDNWIMPITAGPTYTVVVTIN